MSDTVTLTANITFWMDLTTLSYMQLENLRRAMWNEQARRVSGELPAIASLFYSEKQLVRSGQYIRAIKAVRERTNLGLKDAKDVVDAFRREIGVL